MKHYQLAAFAATLITLGGQTVSAPRRVDDYPAPADTHQDEEALAKAQAKRDRKAAKRLADAERSRVCSGTQE